MLFFCAWVDDEAPAVRERERERESIVSQKNKAAKISTWRRQVSKTNQLEQYINFVLWRRPLTDICD